MGAAATHLTYLTHLTNLTRLKSEERDLRVTRPSTLSPFSGVRLGLTETRNPVAVLPLAAFLEQFRALKTLEHISFAAQRGSRAQTSML